MIGLRLGEAGRIGCVSEWCGGIGCVTVWQARWGGLILVSVRFDKVRQVCMGLSSYVVLSWVELGCGVFWQVRFYE